MISVLVPTRGRQGMLDGNIQRLLDLAADPGQVEICVAIDPDEDLVDYVYALPPGTLVWEPPQRYGYAGLHEYYNALAAIAEGEWLMVFGDDAVMQTQGWDTVIAAQAPGILWPSHNDHDFCNIFPVLPRSWFAAMGHLSLLPPVDTWLQEIGEILDCLVKIPVWVIHDAPHLTGRAPDETYAASRRSYLPEHQAMRGVREADARRLRAFLDGV